ncbi:MAG: 50S ribosomal protein L4 [Deltaproteobacteria bacterium]|nr:50S ribosomal protein L4 [Deltaproteobacteria bacterium]
MLEEKKLKRIIMPVQILDTENKPMGEVALSGLESEKLNKAVLYYAVKAHLNNQRHGTASAKQRGEVNITGKKVYRQKGTGRARHGASSVNIFVGGGATHGPKPRSYNEKINKKFKKTGYQEVFKYLVQTGGLKVLTEIKLEKPSTKRAGQILQNLGIKKALVILPADNINGHLSFRNLKNVTVVNENNINVYDMLRLENVILTADFFKKIIERYSL